MRVRFTSPHPKDFPDELLQLIAERPNICSQVHLPLQSGNTDVLHRMRRGYSKEAFVELAARTREIIPGVAISTDIITGFCGETDAEHLDTLEVMRAVGFEAAFMFHYSLREKTHAHRNYSDDVPEQVKLDRLQEVIDLFQQMAHHKMQTLVGSEQLVLVEGFSRKSKEHLTGRADNNKRVVFSCPEQLGVVLPGQYVAVKVDSANAATLKGRATRQTKLQSFYRL